MDKNKIALNYLEEIKELLLFQKASILKIGELLCQLKKDELWRYCFGDSDGTQTFKQFINFELHISESYASRSINVFELFKKQLQLSDNEILEADQNTLYLLIPKLKHNLITEEQAKSYLKLPRQEVRELLSGEHEHSFGETRYAVCGVCKIFKAVDK